MTRFWNERNRMLRRGLRRRRESVTWCAARRLQRLILGNAAPMELDSAGRILIPPTLRSYAHLEKKLMLIGQGKKLELWSEERWFAWLDESSGDEDMPPEMEALSL